MNRSASPSGSAAPENRGKARARASALDVSQADRVNRYNLIVNVLDELFRVPGTRWRFGLDAILGLVPGAGDIATAIIGTTTMTMKNSRSRLRKDGVKRLRRRMLAAVRTGNLAAERFARSRLPGYNRRFTAHR